MQGPERVTRNALDQAGYALLFDQVALPREHLHEAGDDLVQYAVSSTVVSARASWKTGSPALRR